MGNDIKGRSVGEERGRRGSDSKVDVTGVRDYGHGGDLGLGKIKVVEKISAATGVRTYNLFFFKQKTAYEISACLIY